MNTYTVSNKKEEKIIKQTLKNNQYLEQMHDKITKPESEDDNNSDPNKKWATFTFTGSETRVETNFPKYQRKNSN
jgi:hypothetical protein